MVSSAATNWREIDPESPTDRNSGLDWVNNPGHRRTGKLRNPELVMTSLVASPSKRPSLAHEKQVTFTSKHSGHTFEGVITEPPWGLSANQTPRTRDHRAVPLVQIFSVAGIARHGFIKAHDKWYQLNPTIKMRNPESDPAAGHPFCNMTPRTKQQRMRHQLIDEQDVRAFRF